MTDPNLNDAFADAFGPFEGGTPAAEPPAHDTSIASDPQDAASVDAEEEDVALVEPHPAARLVDLCANFTPANIRKAARAPSTR